MCKIQMYPSTRVSARRARASPYLRSALLEGFVLGGALASGLVRGDIRPLRHEAQRHSTAATLLALLEATGALDE